MKPPRPTSGITRYFRMAKASVWSKSLTRSETPAPGFYDRLDRGVAVISVGTNSYGHPSKEVLEAADRSSALLRRTDRDGAVTVLLTPLGGAVRAYR